LHHGAICEAARWHMSADRANADRDAILKAEMVEAVKALIDVLPADLDQNQLRVLIEAEKLLARVEGRSALNKACPAKEGEE
jgi:hypothetical protein